MFKIDKTKKLHYDIAIIGAGPAGLMAAYSASLSKKTVILLEQNSMPGIKLLMTGAQRCNLTNEETDVRKFADKFGKNGKFLLSSLFNFGITKTREFFHSHNLPTKVEKNGKVFPESGKSTDVLSLFIYLLEKNNVSLIKDCKIKHIIQHQKQIKKLITDKNEIIAKNYIICTGGLSYPKTGATGKGYIWAKESGHSIKEPEPALTPVIASELWIKKLEGLSLKNVVISIYQNNKKKDTKLGDALFTDKGLSGPVILDMSNKIGKLLKTGKVQLSIDFKPELDLKKIDLILLKNFKDNPARLIKNTLSIFIPPRLVLIILDLAKIPFEKKCNSITKEERKSLRQLLKSFSINIKSLSGFKKAIITSGGISLKEIDSNTMRSKIINNLFFAGEIIDLDGPTGGYNLQLCWSTGYLAGEIAAKK